MRCKTKNTSLPLLIVFMVLMMGNLSYGQHKTLELIDAIKNDTVYLDLKNYLSGPVLIEFSFKDEMKDFVNGPEEVVIQSEACIPELISIPIELIKDTSSIEWRDYFDVNASLGDPYNSAHNDSILYNLPFSSGKKYRIMQPWNGKLSHFTRESKYALDFDMPEGDTICAAREGIVIRTVDHFTENGGKEHKDKANQVVVLHDDGTMAFYVHLLHRGV
ncbi:MAG: hypothetical protein HKN68_22080, partial [Saprospiraceae bacterium]|nr:hypothetical protein [Saprospiraceae bacterium]